MKKLFLIDGNAIIHRAFHAIPKHFSDTEGAPTNAVYGFTSMLLNIINGQNPEYLAVSFDRPAKTFRHKEFAEYKATRTKAPDELYAQIPRIKEVVEAFNIPIHEIDGFEADDVLGTLSVQATNHKEDLETYIVTGDMDTLQLVNDKVRVFAPQSGFKAAKIYTPDQVVEKHGLNPDQIIDFKALKGDSSDNIPGVPGIGDKGATTLLQKYKTLDTIYENLDEITGSIHDKLAQNKELAYKSQYLATIVLDVPVTLKLEDCGTLDFDEEKIAELFEFLRFRSLLIKLDRAKNPDTGIPMSPPLTPDIGNNSQSLLKDPPTSGRRQQSPQQEAAESSQQALF
jgi:DNA polymerase I